jgi:hypothetical protein
MRMDIWVTLDETTPVSAGADVQQSAERSASVTSMKAKPNHTPPRSIRVTDELWFAAQQVASDRGETVSEVVNRYLAKYVKAGIGKDEDALTRTLRRLGA